ncbi:pyrroline-5-carboxylate reductase [Marinicauda pacifica]|jgi:pyrroline-5-carboxylate reductase|uniref:Pyrroline-5-carboxylate reductase n=1 Tax=Marinicauda pacifica TaxID=1133559 RepID=A0A4V3RZC9_9PROT|nr:MULTISPECIES: pyrroline-5-carboxylate reductase [Marinicauda]TGY93789.1 pyrroline-5-carboxylate reductase [Marinicauda pacifica]GGE30290.1 pyrroline-5-carboxylate reductase [Marinicauda pacifica]
MTNQRNGRLALVGVGRMGAAMAAGWLRKSEGGVPADKLLFVEPELQGPAKDLADKYGVQHLTQLDAETAKTVDTIILAVKPQVMEKILPQLSEVAGEDTLIVSVAAGIGLRAFEKAFPGRPIVRNMPNVPGAIGKGINVAIANERADELKLRDEAETLLKVTGPVEWLEEERLMGAATGVSGSGPAYVFLMAEALARAGEAEGLPADLAERLAVATVSGAGAMLEQSLADGSASAADLRRSVTSPNGTTQAALDVLMGEGGLPSLIHKAVAAAEKRSRELGSAKNDKG